MKYCNKCGNQLLDEAVMCPRCGCSVGSQMSNNSVSNRNVAKATLLILLAIAILVITIMIVSAQINRY